MNNTQKTLKNSLISVGAQITALILQFINRKVFVIFLDIEYLGYQSLFSNVFSLLSVAELGIGNIIAFQMYKEIVNKNNEEIGKLMYLYKWMYRVVALIVCIAGVICYFFLPLFVSDAKESWDYLSLIYFLQLTCVVLGYFLSYKRIMFIATQQEYRCVKTDLYVQVIIDILQVILLAIFHNYIVFLCIQLSISIISNIIISARCNKEYPYVNKKYLVSKEYLKSRNIFKDMRDFVIHKISYAIYMGTDNLIISAFCGIEDVALYGNYVVVQKGVMQILFYKLLNPIQATIGNIVYAERSKDELWKQFSMLDVFSFFFASYIGNGFIVFYQPFIQLWMGEEYLLPDSFVVLFSLTIYLVAVWEIVYKYRSVFGDYKQDRNLMVLSAVSNITVSIIFAKIWGITGVQFGTLIAYLPIAFGRIRFVVRNYFKHSMWEYIGKHCILFVIAGVESGLCFIVCKDLPLNVLGIIGRIIIWFLIPLIINCAVFWKNTHFKDMCIYFKNLLEIIKKKVRKHSK